MWSCGDKKDTFLNRTRIKFSHNYTITVKYMISSVGLT
jgi:hypothetical protein